MGIALAAGLLRVILAAMPAYTLPSEADVRLNLPVLLFTLSATMLAGVLAGCAPAWQAMRSNLVETLKEAGRSVGGGRHPLRRAPRGHRVRAGPHAPGRRRARDPQPGEVRERGPRLRARQPAHLVPARAERAPAAAGADRRVLSAASRTGRGDPRRGVGLGVHGDAGERHGLRHAVPLRGQALQRSLRATRRRVQHGHPAILPHLRHPDGSRARLHRGRPRGAARPWPWSIRRS